MKKKTFTVAACVIATAYWIFESSMHYYLFGEPQFVLIPSDFNEIWMRFVIVMIIVLFGIFADSFINNITKTVAFKEKQLEIARVYNGMIIASLHVVSNLLNQMELFKLEALKSKDFDRDIIRLYDNAINEASNLIDTLSRLEEATQNNDGSYVDPYRTSNSSGNSDSSDEK